MEFYIVDAFTNKRFGGNTAGVVLYENLEEDYMQNLALELRFSETAFIKKISDDNYNLRFFTPNSEVDLCGHATIASFEVLKQLGNIKSKAAYTMSCKAGNLNVYVEENIIMLEQAPPKAGITLHSDVDMNKISQSLNIDTALIGDLNYNLNPQIVSTGIWDILVPVKTQKALRDIIPNYDYISSLSKEKAATGIHVFTLDSKECLASSRNFAPLYGINEEAATGTSNGALTYYLYLNSVISEPNKIYNINQGEYMNRPSQIYTKFTTETTFKVLVGGSAFILSKGELY